MDAKLKRRILKASLVLGACALLVLIAGALWYQHTFPYGKSHCCSKQLGMALLIYAQDHNGAFPSGGPTPEASLGLLYSNYADANVLRGKTVPLEVTKRALEVDGKLGPESTGWHYVEGLNESDDSRVAVIWDKVGLGHNGQLIDGGHEVVFLDGSTQYVSRSAWPKFLEDQKQLLAARTEKAQSTKDESAGRLKRKKE